MTRAPRETEAKKVDTWMPLLVDKYLGDTSHLTTEGHGVYLLLLMAMWKRNGQLPADDKQLAPIAKLSLAKWKSAYREVVLSFFDERDGVLTQKRLGKELARAHANLNQKSAAGKASAEAKRAAKEAEAVNGRTNGRSTGVGTAGATETPTKRQRRLKPIPTPTPIPPEDSGSSGSQDFAPARSAPPPAAEEPGRTVPTWVAYADAYRRRYGEAPVRNKRQNALLAQFVQLVSLEEAPEIAEFYVRRGDLNLYVNSKHSLQLLVRDAEKVRTEWKTGRVDLPMLVPAPSPREEQRRASYAGFSSLLAGPPAGHPAHDPSTIDMEEAHGPTPRLRQG